MEQNNPYNTKDIIWNLHNSNIINDINNSLLGYYMKICMNNHCLNRLIIHL